MDPKIMKLITSQRMHHPRKDKGCLYINRENGGRVLIQLENNHYRIQLENNHYRIK